MVGNSNRDSEFSSEKFADPLQTESRIYATESCAFTLRILLEGKITVVWWLIWRVRQSPRIFSRPFDRRESDWSALSLLKTNSCGVWDGTVLEVSTISTASVPTLAAVHILEWKLYWISVPLPMECNNVL